MNLNFLVTLEAIFIIMLIFITWRQDSIKLFQCSRDHSKIVRDVIYKKFIPIFARYQMKLSHECPFHPDREFLWWPLTEGHQDSFWTCPFCGIDFFRVERLIFHWDKEHRHSQQYKEDLVCLADYCGIFRCDIMMKKMLHRKKFLNYLSFGKSSEIHKCDPDEMNFLQEMCFNVIQQCTIGLYINISSQTIWNLRKELTDSVCSYLTCEHYNDDLFVEENTSRKVPIIFFSTVGLIMLSGFFLLYYLIWNVLKRGLINDNEDTVKVESLKKDDKSLLRKFTHSSNSDHYSSIGREKFFQNIFEFHHENYEDSFEFSDFDTNQVSQFKSKLHAINSIIEEEEEESEMDVSVNSYPNISRKNLKNFQKPKMLLFQQQKQHGSMESNEMMKRARENLRKSQEICFQDLPVKFHSKYIQPVKYSFSDQYPCYSGPITESFSMLSNKSRSYSHSQLKGTYQISNPRRQLSIEKWDPQIQERFHAINTAKILNPKQYASKSKSIDWNGRSRISKSAMSYHMMHPSKRREIYATSKTNSDASIGSGSSRYTVHSNPPSLKT